MMETPPGFLHLVFLMAGLCIGSFLNVCILRMPNDESLVHPRSRCPRCKKRIEWYDNIPVFSFLHLRGRCRGCGRAISPRYPLVELLTAACFVTLYMRWGPLFGALAAAAASALIVIAFIDWDTFLIPDVLSLGLVAAGLAVSPLNPIFSGGAMMRVLQSALGAAAGFAICFGIAWLGEKVLKKEAMGGGDVKLLAGVGAWTGVLGAYDCLVIASFLGSIYGVGLILRSRIKRQDPIPFGPFLSAAAIFNFFYLLPFGWPLNF